MKKEIKSFYEPHRIFLVSALIILLFGFWKSESVMDINFHDTYFVIGYFHFAILISLVLFIIGTGYWIMKKLDIKLLSWLNWTHILLTLGGPVVLLILIQFYRNELMEYEFNNNLTLVILLIVMIMILGQMVFPVNIIYSLIKKKNKKTD